MTRYTYTIYTLVAAFLVTACQPGEMDKFFSDFERNQMMSKSSATAMDEAEVAMAASDFIRAKDRYTDALMEDPNNIDALEGVALAEMNLGEFDAAVLKFNRVLQARPDSWRSLNAIAVLHTLKDQLPQAGEFFIAANKASPKNPVILNNWGLGYAISGDIQNSVMRLNQAIAETKDDPTKRVIAERNLALVYALYQQDERALEVLQRFMTPSEAYHNLSAYVMLRGDEAKSQSYLKQVLQGGIPEPMPVPAAVQREGLDNVLLPAVVMPTTTAPAAPAPAPAPAQ